MVLNIVEGYCDFWPWLSIFHPPLKSGNIVYIYDVTAPSEEILFIGDLPVGAGVAMATPDKERNLSTRNQNVMNKELFTIMKTVHDA